MNLFSLNNGSPKKILLVAAHADDEVLGCGGAISRWVQSGAVVVTVILADGVTSRDVGINCDELINKRRRACEAASKILNINKTYFLDFPDNMLDSLPLISITVEIEKILKHEKPDVLVVHHPGDLNIDHQVAYRAAMTACRPFPGQSVQTILSYEVLSSTEWSGPDSFGFKPNYFIDVTKTFNLKVAALNAYGSEMRPAPHPRSIDGVEALAKLRGFSAGIFMAEAFVIIRHTWR